MGGVPGSRQAGGVFVSRLFCSSNVFGAAVPAEGRDMCAHRRDPLCHDGKCNILFQRSDYAQIKAISIADIAFIKSALVAICAADWEHYGHKDEGACF